jgi:hypothetical protein
MRDHKIAVRLTEPTPKVNAGDPSIHRRSEDNGSRQPHRVVAGLEMPVQAKCLSIGCPAEFVIVVTTEDIGSQIPNGSLNAGSTKEAAPNSNAFSEQRLSSEMFTGNRSAAST